MFKYEYASVNIWKLMGAKCDMHREIINDYAKNGYRYVGYVPTDMNNYGKISQIDLIFEIDVME